jgi:GT2 family glycosyltransferase
MWSESKIRLAVIVPVWGNWHDTAECLHSLSLQTAKDFIVIVADDGSPEPPLRDLWSADSAIYVRYPHRGFAATCNDAAEAAIGRGASHLLFLNSDTICPEELMEGSLRTMERSPEAIISPTIYRHDRPARVWFSGGRVGVLTPFAACRKVYSRITNVDIVSGCALVVPATCWKELGGFDARYVTYYEDFDFVLRARACGISVCVDPSLRVLHKGSASFRGAGVWPQQYLLLSGSLIFIRGHYRGWKRIVCLCLKPAHILAVLVLNLPRLPDFGLLWKAWVRGLTTPVRGQGDRDILCPTMKN